MFWWIIGLLLTLQNASRLQIFLLNCFQLQTNNVLLWARFVIKGSPFITNPFVMSFIIKDDFLSAPVNYAVCYNQLFSLKPLLFNNYQSNYK